MDYTDGNAQGIVYGPKNVSRKPNYFSAVVVAATGLVVAASVLCFDFVVVSGAG
jgi:hypothetical protein